MAKINLSISAFIKEKWLKQEKSQRAFADVCDLSDGVIGKIAGKKEYRIPVETLEKICDAKNVSLHEFFKLLEEYQNENPTR